MEQIQQWHPRQQTCLEIRADQSINEAEREARWHRRRAYEFEQSAPPHTEAQKAMVRDIQSCISGLEARINFLTSATTRRDKLASEGQLTLDVLTRRSWGATPDEISQEFSITTAQAAALCSDAAIDFLPFCALRNFGCRSKWLLVH